MKGFMAALGSPSHLPALCSLSAAPGAVRGPYVVHPIMGIAWHTMGSRHYCSHKMAAEPKKGPDLLLLGGKSSSPLPPP